MIPKIVHMSWKTRDVVDSQAELIQQGLRRLIDLNPDWKIEISTDEEVDAYLKSALSAEDYALVKDIGIVPQTDLWRLFKLFYEGGVYLDIDRLCNKPLSKIAGENIRWVIPTCGDTDFSHDFMMTEPGNPAFMHTINLYLQRRREGCDNVYFLGAQTYMHGVTQTLFGQAISSNPGKEMFDHIRSQIAKLPFVKVYKEFLPNDTVIYQGDVTPEGWEAMKRSFYANNGVKHWTGEW